LIWDVPRYVHETTREKWFLAFSYEFDFCFGLVSSMKLSMHSIRETMGVCDLTSGLQLFKAFFSHFREVDDAISR